MSKQFLEFTDHADWPLHSIVIWVHANGTASVTKDSPTFAIESYPFEIAVEKAKQMFHNEVGYKQIIVHLSEGVSSPQ